MAVASGLSTPAVCAGHQVPHQLVGSGELGRHLVGDGDRAGQRPEGAAAELDAGADVVSEPFPRVVVVQAAFSGLNPLVE